MELQTDLTELADFIGSAEGFAGEVDSRYYIDEVLRTAHAAASKVFDTDTAVVATATQSLNHMYEWGTAGINPAPGAPRLSPTSARAKLWRHRLTGGKSPNKGVDFIFKPSVVPVPLPTPRTSGISSGSVKVWPSRRHTFMARPWITEYGVSVQIKPKYAKALFIPLRGETTGDPRAMRNGFIMTRNSVTVTPGKRLQGNFLSHWYGWWNSTGYAMINDHIEALAEKDMKTVVRASGKKGKAHKYSKGAQTKQFTLRVQSAKAAAQAEMKSLSGGRLAEDTFAENKDKIYGGHE